jgi:hypothetical protein
MAAPQCPPRPALPPRLPPRPNPLASLNLPNLKKTTFHFEPGTFAHHVLRFTFHSISYGKN